MKRSKAFVLLLVSFGLISAWSCNGGGGGGGGGAPPTPVVPQRPSYLQFDGANDQVTVRDPSAGADLNGGAFTIAAWINLASWGQDGLGTIIDHGGPADSASGWGLHVVEDTGGLRMTINGQRVGNSNPGVLDLGAWHHVAVTYLGGTLTFYVDGVPVGSVSGVPVPVASQLPLLLGMRAGTLDLAFEGGIDGVWLFSRALSQAEIQALMRDETDPTSGAVVMALTLDEGSGQTLSDQSGNGNDGLLGGSGAPEESDPRWVVEGSLVNQAPVVSAGPDQTITLPQNTVTLNATVTDDGLPSGSTVAVLWVQLEGPAPVTFSPVDSPQTTVTFSAPGAYTLQLTASDSVLSSSDQVVVTVNPEPDTTPPQVAITDPSEGARVQGIVTVEVTASDPSGVAGVDFLVDGTPLSSDTTEPYSASWDTSLVPDGPHSITAVAADTAGNQSSDTIGVQVVNAQNQPPVVNAGEDQSITWPADVVTLTGTATDDGLPLGSVVTVQWTMVTGPAPVTFSAPTSLQTMATFSEPGEYVLRLTATDSELSASDDVTVRVRVLSRIEVTPSWATLASGQQQQFVAAGFDQFGDSLEFDPRWSATGGVISRDGLYTAGSIGGTFEVTASDSGAVSGSAAVTVIPPKNTYLDFDGNDDYVDISPSSDLDLTGDFTISAWINPASWGELNQGRIIDHGGGSSGDRGGWTFQLWGDSESLAVQIQSSSGPVSPLPRSRSHVIRLNVWQHVAVTLQNRTVTFYVDGFPVGTVQNVSSPAPRALPVRIGMRASDMKRAFNGSIDEIALWSRALGAEEIQAYKDAGLSGNEDGLVAYWRLNEDGEEQQINDSTPNGHNGVLGSTPGPDGNDPLWASGTEPAIWIVSPQSLYLQSAPDLTVLTGVRNLRPGWGVRFVLDRGEPGEISRTPVGAYEYTFEDVVFGEHTIDVFVVDDRGAAVSGTRTHDRVVNVARGHYYVALGDSITKGTDHDDVPGDDTSQDGRNTGGGYQPILNDLLTAYTGIPCTVERVAWGGMTSEDGVSESRKIFNDEPGRHPQAEYALIQLGTNDALDGVPSGVGLDPRDPASAGTYKANMQEIIDNCLSRGKIPVLAKVPVIDAPCLGCDPYPDPLAPGTLNVVVQQYNQAISELAAENGLTVVGPDFFGVFLTLDRSQYYDDWLHPNGLGFGVMAQQWFDVLKDL